MSRPLYWACLICPILFPVLAQNITGSLKGLLQDPSGAPVAAAPVVLVNSQTGFIVRTSTNQTGAFVFASVPAGTYEVSIEAAGFKKYVRKEVGVTASEIRDLGVLSLQTGEVRETITVEDTPTPLQLASGEKSGLVSGSQLSRSRSVAATSSRSRL